MKKNLPIIVVVCFALWILAGMAGRKPVNGFDIQAFSKLPVLLNGRVQPMDSVGRNSLLLIRTKSSVYVDAKAEAETLTNTLAKISKEQSEVKASIQKLTADDLGQSSEALTNAMFAQVAVWKKLETAQAVAALHTPDAVVKLQKARDDISEAVKALNSSDQAGCIKQLNEAEASINSGQAQVVEGIKNLKSKWQSLWVKLTGQGAMSSQRKSYEIPASDWLLEVMTKPEIADQRRIFQIHHPELLDNLQLDTNRKYFTFAELTERKDEDGASANLRWLQSEADRLRNIEQERQTPFDKQVGLLHRRVGTYARLKSSLQPESTVDFEEELKVYQDTLTKGIPALQSMQAGSNHDTESLNLLSRFFQRYTALEQMALPLILPPLQADHSKDNWANIGAGLKVSMKSGQIHPAALQYAKLSTAYRNGDSAAFNTAVQGYQGWLAQQGFATETRKGSEEAFFNHYEPFYKSMAVYVVALLLACSYWLNWNPTLRSTAFYLLGLAFVVHTSGLIFRMYLEGRPPVTNLYSSAIFVGWGAVGLGWILERIYKDAVGIVVACAVGFSTLIIAHHLSLSGDTMEMMRAVLDTNFWLATHVVVITLGYASTFVAGFLAIIYIVRGFLTNSLGSDTAKSLSRMAYGILCFSTLFSFVGTILGGIWADQSWGRFWGWDPKENGALMIVLWCAIVLHARWSGMIRERGLMVLSVAGNIVTAFSWFGVNMLGIGLHSYGFMDSAFKWLMAFNATQLIIIAMGMMPLRYWKSCAHLPAPKPAPDEGLDGTLPEGAKA